MRGKAGLVAILLLLAPLAAFADSIVAGLSQNRVSITASFNGSQIIVYGAIKRESPLPPEATQMIVTIEGPGTPVVVRRKDRVGGIWINDASAKFKPVPSFYEVATTAPLQDILNESEDRAFGITLPQFIGPDNAVSDAPDKGEFSDALLRIRSSAQVYRLSEGAVSLVQDTLFRTDVDLPANLIEGEYRVRIFLLRGGQVLSYGNEVIDVRRAGLERFLFSLSKQQPFLYGLVALALAAFAGWASSEVFRRLRA